MTGNQIYKYSLFLLGITMLSCSEDGGIKEPVSSKIFEASASIENNETNLTTRVETYYGDGQDYWSFSRFSDRKFKAVPLSQQQNSSWEWEEALGFFSNKGNNQSSDGKFVNEKMWFTRSLEDDRYATFISTDMDVNLNDLRSGGSAYFPYVEEIESKGLELRWIEEETETPERCIDALIMRRINTDGSTVSGMNFHFYHAFSEMVIIRGEGFERPMGGNEINVYLTEGYSHAVFEDYEPVEEKQTYLKNFRFLYNDDYDAVKSREDCKKWGTWKGNFSFTQSGTAAIVKDAWFVLLPGGFDINRPSVDYIELYDNYGTLHKITDFNLYNNDGKRLNWNERYILEVKMEGLTPTCNPVLVEPWGGDREVAQRRALGISSESEFRDFVTVYNGYASGRNSYENTLSKYGDLTINGTGEKYWHFYISEDFEFNEENLTINLLHENDIIDGLNNRVSNVTGTFIKTLKGSLQNVNLSVNIKNETKTGNVGGVIESIDGGNVSSCTVSGTVNCPRANVGLLGGSSSDAVVKNCIFSGLLIGNGSFDYILGTEPSGMYDKTLNSTTGVIFLTNE